MKNIWLNEEQLQSISKITSNYEHLFHSQEDMYDEKFREFLQFRSFLSEEELNRIRFELKKSYQLKNDSEFKKVISNDVRDFLISIASSYQSFIYAHSDKILTNHGYQSLIHSYSLYEQIVDQIDSEVIVSSHLANDLELSYHYLVHAFSPQFLVEPDQEKMDYQYNYVSKFKDYSEILEYAMIGFYSYFDYLRLCQNFKAMEEETKKVKNLEKEEFTSSVFGVALRHPEFLSYYDEKTLKELKEYIYLRMNESSLDEKDTMVEILHEINAKHLKLTKN